MEAGAKCSHENQRLKIRMEMLRADESDTPLTPPESGHLQVTRQNTWPGCTEQEACSSLAAAAHSPNAHAALFHSMKEKRSQIDKLLTCTSSLRLGGQQVSGHILERAELCAVKREIGVTCRSYEKKVRFQMSSEPSLVLSSFPVPLCTSSQTSG